MRDACRLYGLMAASLGMLFNNTVIGVEWTYIPCRCGVRDHLSEQWLPLQWDAWLH